MSGTEIKLDFSHVMAESVGSAHGLTVEEFETLGKRLTGTDGVHAQLQAMRRRGELGFADLPQDTEMLSRVQELARSVREKFENFVVLGIGGSSLGAKALIQALTPAYSNYLTADLRSGPRIFFCDNLDPDSFAALLNLLDLRKTVFNVISKSGGTLETLAQFWLVWNRLRAELGEKVAGDHLILTTDPRQGDLRAICNEMDLEGLVVPPAVGGRFSVLSAVGLLPAAAAGIAVEKVLAGAHTMSLRCNRNSLWENPAYVLAAITYLLDTKRGKKISVLWPYSDGLEEFTGWLSQLIAESLGKNGKGVTPVRARGATDQHSQLQLYLDGPSDKCFTIFEIERFHENRGLPEVNGAFAKCKSIQQVAGHSLATLMTKECEATRHALVQASRPTVSVRLPALEAGALGELMFLYEMQTVVVGLLQEVNPFNQPAVESGKARLVELLKQRAPVKNSNSKYIL